MKTGDFDICTSGHFVKGLDLSVSLRGDDIFYVLSIVTLWPSSMGIGNSINPAGGSPDIRILYTMFCLKDGLQSVALYSNVSIHKD